MSSNVILYLCIRYDIGHLHGLHLEIDLEPDALHRETLRRLSGGEHSQPLVLERGYTSLGQLDHLTLRGANSTAGEQQYQYDALGRMSFLAQQIDPADRLQRHQHQPRQHH